MMKHCHILASLDWFSYSFIV